MKTAIIHGRKVYLFPDECGEYKVIQDVDGKIPYNKWYNVYYNASGCFTAEYIRKQEKAGKIEWR